jgi:hypothetical protein
MDSMALSVLLGLWKLGTIKDTFIIILIVFAI